MKTPLDATPLVQTLSEHAGRIERDMEARLLRSRLTPSQTEALEHFKKAAISLSVELDNQANASAMKSLLEPNVPLHITRAHFRHAKARAVEFGLLQFRNMLNSVEGSFDEFVRDTLATMDSARSAHACVASAMTHMLVGKDSTTEEYALKRIHAAEAQGREEAYMDLAWLFEFYIARARSGIVSSHLSDGPAVQ